MENLGFGEIIGVLLFAVPLLIYLTQCLFDGIGYFRDQFHTSGRRR
jgi:hypothetical protein